MRFSGEISICFCKNQFDNYKIMIVIMLTSVIYNPGIYWLSSHSSVKISLASLYFVMRSLHYIPQTGITLAHKFKGTDI